MRQGWQNAAFYTLPFYASLLTLSATLWLAVLVASWACSQGHAMAASPESLPHVKFSRWRV
jgi:hypothetical protein